MSSPARIGEDASDTAIVDPPTWFTTLPGTMTADGTLPLTGFFLSGLAPFDWTAGRGLPARRSSLTARTPRGTPALCRLR